MLGLRGVQTEIAEDPELASLSLELQQLECQFSRQNDWAAADPVGREYQRQRESYDKQIPKFDQDCRAEVDGTAKILCVARLQKEWAASHNLKAPAYPGPQFKEICRDEVQKQFGTTASWMALFDKIYPYVLLVFSLPVLSLTLGCCMYWILRGVRT